jgi:Flp pilus assembly protein TadD
MDSLGLAIKYFNKALSLEPNEALVYSNRGYAFYKMHDYSRALSDINKSISLYPTNSYAYRNLALVYIAINNLHGACNALSYAAGYGFTSRYGSEVNELLDKYCK